MTLLLRESVPLDMTDFKRHLRFSFTVPPQAHSLQLRLRFDPFGAGEIRSMINFSLFGPQGFVGACHRHGTEHEVWIGEDWATPGFLAGQLAAGEWTVVVHTHMVADHTELELEVWAEQETPPAPPPEAPLKGVAARPVGWMMGDLHCHSTHSDARWTVRQLAEAATTRGLRFLALTDHNTTSGRAELARLSPGLLQLPGLELTTFYGHATVLGLDGYQDWTGLTALSGVHQLAAEVSAAGGHFTIAHPFQTGDPVCTGCAWTYFDLRPAQASHMEVWNGSWAGPKNEQALAHWYALLASGLRVIATTGTDAHGMAYDSGHGFTCTPVTQDQATLLAQLKAGNTYLSRSADLGIEVEVNGQPAPLGSVQAAGDWTLRLRWQRLPEGCRLHLIADGQRTSQALTSSGELSQQHHISRWLNLEIRLPDGELYTLSNPVWAQV